MMSINLSRPRLLRAALWPKVPAAEHDRDVRAVLAGRPRSTLPLAVFVADAGRDLAGFVEVGLRSRADGCDPAHPVGYVEGWYVAAEHRRKGLARALLAAAETWARAQGCRELASDTWITSAAARRAHESLGFEVVNECVNYRKRL